MPMQGISEVELSYFELQAYVGTTKHMGGLKATEELLALCPIDGDAYVLDVGCGADATACYLAKKYGCRVMGVDLLESMIARSSERARRESVADRAEFRVADAQDLPFEDALFDLVIGESVITFIEDKGKAVSECVRVTKPGGYVGLNEETWMKTPVPAELVEFVSRTWGGAKPETPDGWAALLEGAGLRDVVVRTHRFSALREASQIRRYSFGDLARMLYRTVSLYTGSPAFRRYMKGRRSLPRNIWDYLGYGIYVGRK